MIGGVFGLKMSSSAGIFKLKTVFKFGVYVLSCDQVWGWKVNIYDPSIDEEEGDEGDLANHQSSSSFF